ncbi:prephenate dehydratase-like protein [Elsinoe australis]|uniref:prephenate dehydratase n=1 Tax=Elsinoe australis TaxID=40998 RepID=A0A4V6DUW4_9PEZI|nr:prephenate dehydratase-like protein [Elsinoe australis]
MADKVAYLGPKASYTHQATLQHFPTPAHTLDPSPSISSVFTSVQSSKTKYGVVPFENSSNGAVLPTLDLFATLPTTNPDVTIIGEEFVSVKHCLLGRLVARPSPSPSKPVKLSASGIRDGRVTTTEGSDPAVRSPPLSSSATPPAADLSGLKVLHTHPQAWGQITRFLASLPPGVEKLDSSSTSAAAAKVAKLAAGSADGTTSEAAIASRLAGEVYGLDVLREGINDRVGNVTRFFVLGRRDDVTDGSGSGTASGERQAGKEGGARKTRTKTLLHFRVPSHENPGALADALAVFKKWGLSLTSFYTRPEPEVADATEGRDGEGGQGKEGAMEEAGEEAQDGNRWRYIFFVEFASEVGQEEAVAAALEELRGVSRGLAVVGRWGSK